MRTRPTVSLVRACAFAACLLAAPAAAPAARPDKDARVNKLIIDLFNKDEATRLAAIKALGSEGSPRAIEALGRVLHARDKKMCVAAAAALAKAGPGGAKVLAESLGRVDLSARLEIVAAASTTGHRECLVLLRVLARDAEPRVRAKAVAAIGHVTERLIRQAGGSIHRRDKTSEAIFRDPAVTQALGAVNAAAKDSSPTVRMMAAIIFCCLSPDGSAARLKAMRNDADESVRLFVTWASLRQAGGRLTRADKVTAERLKQPFKGKGVSFEQVPLELVIQFFREVSGVSVHVNWRELNQADIDTSTEVVCKGVKSPAELLDAVLWSVGKARADWLVDGNIVHITTATGLSRLWETPPRLTVLKPDHDPEATREVVHRYKQRLPKVDFPEVPLVLTVQFMREILAVPIYVRWSALKARKTGPATECTAHLLDVTGLQLLAVMFDDVAGSRRCRFVICGEMVLITTREDLAVLAKAERPKGLIVTDAMIAADIKSYLAGSEWTESSSPITLLAANGRAKAFARVLGALDPGQRARTCVGAMGDAINRRHVKTVAFLLDQGVDIECRTSERFTPLHRAAKWGEPKILSLLIARGAKVNALSNEGTPLAVAEEKLVEEQEELKDVVGKIPQWRHKRIAAFKQVITILRKHGGKDKLRMDTPGTKPAGAEE